MLFFHIIFLDFIKQKLGPKEKNLRHSSLDQNVGYIYRKSQLSIYHSKRDIDVQKIKVKNAIFVFSALSHVFPTIYFYNIYINICDY